MRKLLILAACGAMLSGLALAETTVWQIDPNHTNAQFVVRHLGISNVQGQFNKVTGSLQLDDQDVTKSSVNATIDINSVDTRVDARDKDLRSPNFFDVAKYPTMTFVSKKVARAADGKLLMTGDLTFHGVTREVTFTVDGPSDVIKDPWGGMRRGASATTKIKRSDFGMNYLMAVAGDDIAITLDVEFIKK
jgi:polyisoprenoid-binding protein YceI